MPFDATWSRRGLAALHAMLDVDDRTRRDMIQFLFDEGFWDAHRLTWDAAVARWNDGKNPSKTTFFKVGELWALALRFERHQLFLAVMESLGYTVRRTPTEERRQALLEQMVDAMTRCEQTLEASRAELARLGAPETCREVPAVYGDPVRFSRDDAPGGF
ncbi:hypothetical protein [Rhodanobacter lindaniclasticus]